MVTPIIKTSFAAGEVAPSLSGRVDLAKYQTGATVMRNFFVDYRGGASTRPGTKHVGVCRPRPAAGNPKPRLIPFVFNSEQTYILELNVNLMRVIFRGGYVTETALVVTGGNNTSPAKITVPGHNFIVGDYIAIDGVGGMSRPNGVSGVNGRTLYVQAVAGDTITLGDPVTWAPINGATWSAYVSGGTAARIYEIPTPWNADVLFALKYVQSADVMTVTNLDFRAYDIRRLAHNNWQIVQETYGTPLPPPANIVATAMNDGGPASQVFFYAYAVTVIDENGQESIVSPIATCLNKALDQTITPTRINRITWGAVPGAYKYRVYKAQPVPEGTQGGGPYFFGVIANVFDTGFVDVNYFPDYTVGPPIARNPFLDNGIASAAVVLAGTGYVSPYAVISDATGSGAAIALASDLSPTAAPYGALTAANIVAQGAGYSAPTVTVLDAAPAGSGLVLAFSGAWVANPLGTGFMPAPGSITIGNPGQNYHFKTANNFVRARAGNPVGANYLYIDVALVAYGAVQSISWANGDVSPSPSTGLSSTGTGDTLTFEIVGSDTTGAGALVTVALGGTTNPNCCTYLQQRRVFGGSRSKPSTLWMSQPGQFTNFNITDPVQDNNAITAALNAQEVNVIEAMVAAPGGLVVLTSGGAYLVTGDNNGGVTPGTIQANPQAFTGTQKDLQPLRVGNQLIYAQARGSAVAELAYNFYTSQFTSMDISVLSAHLLEGHYITQWAFATEPYKTVWAVRDDGVLLCLTYLKEQEVYGWSRHDTHGKYVSVVSVPEDREDAVYVVVKRDTPASGVAYHVERMQSRDCGADNAVNVPASAESAWCVDGGVALTQGVFATDIIKGIPVALGTVYSGTVDFGGSNYVAPVVDIDDLTGTGAEITVSVLSGAVVGVTVVQGGSKYTNPVVTVRDVGGGGSGAVVSVRLANLVDVYATGAFGAGAFDGSVLRMGGGKGTVVSTISSSVLRVDFASLPAGAPNAVDQTFQGARGAEWSLTTPVSVVGGLDHLNGAVVQVVADGSVQGPKTVIDGCITLDAAASSVLVGLGFTCQLQTMRLEPGGETMQGRRKTIPTLVLRTKDTRGLTAGADWTNMVEVKEREHESFGEPIVLQDGGQIMPQLYPNAPVSYVPLSYPDKITHLQTDYREDGQVCVQQSWPLPATVLAVIPFLNAGDTVK